MEISTELRAIVDSGSDITLINGSLQAQLQIPTVAAAMNLQFGDGSRGAASRRTTRQTVRIQGTVFHESFYVTTKDVPGVDVAFGCGFVARSGASMVWPALGSTDVPYLRFRDGTRWYSEDVVQEIPFNAEDNRTDALVRRINAEQTAEFVKQSGGQFTALVLRVALPEAVDKAKEGGPNKKPIPSQLKIVIEEFSSLFREDLPKDLPQQRVDQPNSLHHIPLIEGAEPVKVRAIPMSYGEQLILQELLIT